MTLRERIRAWVETLPSEHSSVTLTRADLARLLEAPDSADAPSVLGRDLSVNEVAERLGRDGSTVRGWLCRGEIPGAFKLNRKSWLIPEAALQGFLHRQANEPESEVADSGAVDISAWRMVKP